MRAEIVGIPPVPTGLTWASGTIEFSFDPNWSDGAGRGPGTISGILQPTTRDKFVVPGSLGALFVPATPTGTGVIRGPLMSMRWSLIDSQGREYRVDSVFPDSLLADAGNLFNVNAIGATPTYVTSPGPAPVGVDIATGDARYVRFTSLATTAAVGVSSLATDVEAIAGVNTAKIIVPSSLKAAQDAKMIAPAPPSLAYNTGIAGFPTLQTAAVIARTRDSVSYLLVYNVTPASAGAAYYGLFPPAGWQTQSVSYGVVVASSGAPILNCLSEAGDLVAQFGSSVAHKLIARATIVKI